jgi:hypothetical protein
MKKWAVQIYETERLKNDGNPNEAPKRNNARRLFFEGKKVIAIQKERQSAELGAGAEPFINDYYDMAQFVYLNRFTKETVLDAEELFKR